MLDYGFNGQFTKAEISYESFPCGSCATEADRALRSSQGLILVIFEKDRSTSALRFYRWGLKGTFHEGNSIISVNHGVYDRICH